MFGLIKRILKKLEVLMALYINLPNMTLPVLKVQCYSQTRYFRDFTNPIRAGPW